SRLNRAREPRNAGLARTQGVFVAGGYGHDRGRGESDRCSPLARARQTGGGRHQTRLRFRGRTPLWACGVTSLTPRISSPAACSERIAVSRPEPGPFTKTSTFWRPCSIPLRAHASAVTCAANGVDLREPLKPAEPADSHAITLPSLSVSETIVVLNDVLMCAWPIAMVLRTRRRARPRVACLRGGAIRFWWPPSCPGRPSSSAPCACARWSSCAGRSPAGRAGGGCRGRRQSPAGA